VFFNCPNRSPWTKPPRFLLAKFHMDTLAKEYNKKSMRKILRNLPKDLPRIYEDAIQRVHEQDSSSARLAWRVLSWLSYAFEPLTVRQLQHALAVELGDTTFDDEAMTDPEDLVSVCAGLVTIDDESQIIRLIHYTTQEYFEQVRDRLFPGAQVDIAGVCLTYLMLDDVGEQCDAMDADGFNKHFERGADKLHQRYPFLSYAMEYWAPHVRGDREIMFEVLIQDFIAKQATTGERYSLIRKLFRNLLFFRDRVSRSSIAAFFGLTRTLEAEIKKGIDVNDVSDENITALFCAVEGEHEDTVLLLLQAGADAQAGMSAIGPAIKCGNLRLAKLLIDSGGDINIRNSYDRFPALHTACEEGNERVVRFMLDHGADVDSLEYISSCAPLWFAVHHDHPNIVSMLLESGADVNQDSPALGPVLFDGCLSGNVSMTRLILAAPGCDPNIVSYLGGTPLQAAIMGDNGAIAQLLLAHGANADIADEEGRTALFAAADCCSESAVEVIAKHGVDVNKRSLDGSTVLSNCRQHRKTLESPDNTVDWIPKIKYIFHYPIHKFLERISMKSFDRIIQILVDHGATG